MLRSTRRRGFPALMVVFIVAACAEDAAPPAPASSDPAPVAVDAPAASPLGDAALALLPEVRDRTTLLRWRAARPDDQIDRFDPTDAGPYATHWCAVARAKQPAGSGVSIVQHAYFFPPAEVPARIPEPLAEGELLSRCELGVVWLELTGTDGADGEDHALTTVAALEAALGAPASNREPRFAGPVRWSRSGTWNHGGVRLSAGLADAASDGSARGPAQRATVILSSAREPAGGAEPAFADGDARLRVLIDRMRELLTLAALPPHVAERVVYQLRPVGSLPEDSLRSIDGDASAALVTELVGAAAHLPTQQRAAALLAADLLVAAVQGGAGWHTSEGAGARLRLQALGAAFRFAGEPRADWFYTRNRAEQAMALDPAGRVGELAFVVLMEEGFDPGGTCRLHHGIAASREVARRGEAYLREQPGSSVRADVLRMIGDAHADVVAVAAGMGSGGLVEAEQFRGEAATARLLAMESYRAALALDASSPAGRAAARAAWRLAAGLPPSTTRFYCAYD